MTERFSPRPRTVAEALIAVMRDNKAPMTPHEAYEAVIKAGLY